MQSLNSFSFLRRVLALDAASSGAMGLALLAFGAFAANLFELPVELVREAGLVLIPFAAFVAFCASRPESPRIGVWIVIGLNIVWAIDSIALLFTGWIEPNALGVAFIVGQAAFVAAMGALEYVGLRRDLVTA